jgi:hypothetical protein
MSVRKDPNPLFKNCKKINFHWPVRTQQAMNDYSCCCWIVALKIPTAYLSGFRVFQKGLRSDIIYGLNNIIKTSPCLSYLLFFFDGFALVLLPSKWSHIQARYSSR